MNYLNISNGSYSLQRDYQEEVIEGDVSALVGVFDKDTVTIIDGDYNRCVAILNALISNIQFNGTVYSDITAFEEAFKKAIETGGGGGEEFKPITYLFNQLGQYTRNGIAAGFDELSADLSNYVDTTDVLKFIYHDTTDELDSYGLATAVTYQPGGNFATFKFQTETSASSPRQIETTLVVQDGGSYRISEKLMDLHKTVVYTFYDDNAMEMLRYDGLNNDYATYSQLIDDLCDDDTTVEAFMIYNELQSTPRVAIYPESYSHTQKDQPVIFNGSMNIYGVSEDFSVTVSTDDTYTVEKFPYRHIWNGNESELPEVQQNNVLYLINEN